jgi:peroxiredoxin
MPRPSSTLQLGDPAPDFELTCAVSGEPVELADLLRDRAGLLLVFHRGLW